MSYSIINNQKVVIKHPNIVSCMILNFTITIVLKVLKILKLQNV